MPRIRRLLHFLSQRSASELVDTFSTRAVSPRPGQDRPERPFTVSGFLLSPAFESRVLSHMAWISELTGSRNLDANFIFLRRLSLHTLVQDEVTKRKEKPTRPFNAYYYERSTRVVPVACMLCGPSPNSIPCADSFTRQAARYHSSTGGLADGSPRATCS